MPLVKKTYVVPTEGEEIGQRVDRAVQALCGLPRAQINGLFDHGCVQVNGAICPQSFTRVAAGDKILLSYDPAQKYRARNKPRGELGFEIAYEDRYLLIVNKPSDLLTVPTIKGETNTLVDKVSHYVRHVAGGKQAYTAHRLDRGVSGLLVMGKSAEVSQKIRDQFASHKPEREYVAIVAGRISKPEGTFRSFLATDKDLNRFSTDDESIGQLAITHYRVVRQFSDATQVQIWLETGRRNQIRVHFAEAGHPVLGDPRYRSEQATHPLWRYRRLALHARLLGFEHPVTGHKMRFDSVLPSEMERFLAATER